MALKYNCDTCTFYSPNPNKPGLGQCRAHAPVLIMTEHGPRTQWPITRIQNWCGDHATIEHEGEGEDSDQQ